MVVVHLGLVIIMAPTGFVAFPRPPIAIEVDRILMSFLVELVGVPQPAETAVVAAGGLRACEIVEILRGADNVVVGAQRGVVGLVIAETWIGAKPAADAVHRVEFVAGVEVAPDIVVPRTGARVVLPFACGMETVVHHDSS